jgi:hypothetical protein
MQSNTAFAGRIFLALPEIFHIIEGESRIGDMDVSG